MSSFNPMELLKQGLEQGIKKRQESLKLLHQYEGNDAKPSCDNCKFMKLPHEGLYCYVFSEGSRNVPVEIQPCGQWKYWKYLL